MTQRKSKQHDAFGMQNGSGDHEAGSHKLRRGTLRMQMSTLDITYESVLGRSVQRPCENGLSVISLKAVHMRFLDGYPIPE